MGWILALAQSANEAGQAHMLWDYQNQANNQLRDAINSLKPYKIDELKTLASDTDIDRYKRQFETQAEVDPRYAQLRDKGAQGILDALNADRSGQTIADKSLATLSSDLDAEHPETQALIDKLVERANADLDAGATLPPEFQSELIRAGLEHAGGTGYSIDGRGAAGTNIRGLLGSEGLALKERREAEARTNVNAAEQLRARRASVLEGLATLDNNLRGAKVLRASGASQLGNATVPALGLTGADVTGISMSNTDLWNQKQMARGQIRAQNKMNDAQHWISAGKAWGRMLQPTTYAGLGDGGMGGMGGGEAGGAAASSGMSGMQGMEAGGGYGGGGGYGSNIGGLLSRWQ